jgi:ribokinase
MVTPDGENAIALAPGANAALTPEDVAVAEPLLAECAVLVVQFEVPLDAVACAVRLAGEETTVVVNAAPYVAVPGDMWRGVDVVVCNRAEASALTGHTIRSVEDALTAGEAACRYGPRAAVIMLGSHGAVAVGPGFAEHISAPAVRAVDTTGAGDALVGVLACGLARGDDLVAAVRSGVATASATTEHSGADGVVRGMD